MEKGKRYI